ncbi:IS4 family transposase, partial [Sporosarcina ureae]|uniref:IS4 family transposase n=1 Tax=Sporosarcina ureae TaxID=1571 RepID=UPI0026EDC307
MSINHHFDMLEQLLSLIHPERVDALAKETGFIKRKRQITAGDFLMLLFKNHGNLLDSSLQELCVKLSLDQDISVSRTAIDKKFTPEAAEFLLRLIHEVVIVQNQLDLSSLLSQDTLPFTSIRVMDSTFVSVPDHLKSRAKNTHQQSAKVHFEFDLLSGQSTFLKVDFIHINDAKMGSERLPYVVENELCMQDLGYFSFEQFKRMDQSGVFFISKTRNDMYLAYKNPYPTYHKNGKPIKSSQYHRIDLVELCRNLQPGEYLELEDVYFGGEAHFPARCIIFSHGEKQIENRLKKIDRRTTKSGKEPKQVIRDLAGITVYMTNLPISISEKQVTLLYRLRWQVELQFKVWKSYIKIDHFKLVKNPRWLCHLYATLLVCIISQFIAYQIRNIIWEEKEMEISEMIAVRTISNEVLPKLYGIFHRKKKGCIVIFQAVIQLLCKTARKPRSANGTAIHHLLFN